MHHHQNLYLVLIYVFQQLKTSSSLFQKLVLIDQISFRFGLCMSLFFTLTFPWDLFFFFTSGVNLKVPLRASGSDRIDVLPQRGTVLPLHERQRAVELGFHQSLLFSVLQIRPKRRPAVWNRSSFTSLPLGITTGSCGGHWTVPRRASSTSFPLHSVWKTKWSTCMETPRSGSGSSTSSLLFQVSGTASSLSPPSRCSL